MNRFVAILFCFVTVSIVSRADEGVTVEPLVKVEWGQYAPYNQFCPQLGDGNAAAGCVAVTMAQAMSVYNPVDGGDMTNIAKLIADCGEAAKTHYGQSSTATIGNQVRALVDKYGYDADITLHNREFTTAEEWKTLIEEELQSGRLVMVSATDPDYGGHSFIIDGCRNDSVHINWGWTGEWNGYYSLDNLNPDKYHFTDKQRIIAGFKPDNGKKESNAYWEGKCSLSATQMAVDNLSAVSASLTIYNCSYRTFSGYIYLYLVSSDGTRKRIYNKTLYDSMLDNQSYDTFRFTLPAQPGEYTISLELYAFQLGTASGKIVGDTKITVTPSSTDIEDRNADVENVKVRKCVKNNQLIISTPWGDYGVSGKAI